MKHFIISLSLSLPALTGVSKQDGGQGSVEAPEVEGLLFGQFLHQVVHVVGGGDSHVLETEVSANLHLKLKKQIYIPELCVAYLVFLVYLMCLLFTM